MARIIVIAAAALAALPAVATAQSSAPISVTARLNQATVSYADLDIGSSAGKRMLNRRIAWAIEEVCGSFANVREYYEEEHIIHCRAEARHSVDRQLALRPATQRLALNVPR